MTTRWWQHDDRAGEPVRAAGYDGGAYRQQQQQQPAPHQQPGSYGMPAPQQQHQQHGAGAADAAQGPAPGFNRAANPTAPKAALPKVRGSKEAVAAAAVAVATLRPAQGR